MLRDTFQLRLRRADSRRKQSRGRAPLAHIQPRYEVLEERVVLASTLPAGFQENLVVGGLYEPTAMAFAPDGRIFVTEKPFGVRVVQNGSLLPTPFLTLPIERSGERGVEDVSLDPNFATNGYIYVYYTHSDPTAAYDRLSRFKALPGNPNVGDPNSETVILDHIPTMDPGYHNGGMIKWGADGMLYLGIGDLLVPNNVPDLSKLNGKLLRLDVNNYPNIIPSDNPFVGVAGARPEIWAYGFRNPYTGDFIPGTNTLFVNDVGSGSWEEINVVTKGANYGWPNAEGMSTNPAYTNPIYTYSHNGFTSAAITGGSFYTGSAFPSQYYGTYFFSDYANGFMRNLNPATGVVTSFGTNVFIPVHIDQAPDGSLYWVSLGPGSDTNGAIYRISYTTGNRAPNAVANATSVTNGAAPLTVNFSGAGSTDPDGDALTYTWNFGDGNTATGITVSHTYSTNGTYNATLTVNDRPNGAGLSNTAAAIPISVGNRAPTALITLPLTTTTFKAGDTISFAGTGTDPEDGTLPASAFNWSIVFHHETHTHPFLDSVPGVKSGTFQIPLSGEIDPVQWYRVTLTVTDSKGLQSSTFVDVDPVVSAFTLAANFAGLTVNLDGTPTATPTTIQGVVNMTRTITAPATQTVAGQTYTFASWSDGGAAQHDIATPATATTFTAIYTATNPPVALSASYSSTPPTTAAPGQVLNYLMTVTNTGSQTWSATGTNLVNLGVYFSGNSDTIYDWNVEPIRFNIPNEVAPGATVTIPVSIAAPTALGTYTLRQRMVKEFVAWFEPLQKTSLVVSNATPVLNASYASNPPTTATPGQTINYTMVVTNTGNQTWSAAGATPVKLGVYFNGTSDAVGAWPTEPQQFNLPNDVAPGASVSIPVSIAVPATAGTYVLRQRMNQVGVSWFTPLQTTNVVVSAATQALSASYSSTPPTTANPGQVLTYTMTVTNTGTQTWSNTGTNLVNLGVYFSGNSDTIYDWNVEPIRFALPSNVAPGTSVTIPVSIAAPATAGTYILRQRMVKEYVAWFTPLQTTTVAVGVQALGATIAPATGSADVATSINPTVTFTTAMNAATINGTTIDLRDASNAVVPATVTYNATTFVATITPTAALANSTTYKVTVHSGAGGVATSTGGTLATDVTSSFTTVGVTPVWSASYLSNPPTTATPGQTLSYWVMITNTGNQTWSATGAAPVTLGVYFNGTSDAIGAWPTEPQQFSLTNDVAPGASTAVMVNIAAPATAGSYVLRQRMNHVGVAWFTQLQTSNIVVSQALGATLAPTTGATGVATTIAPTVAFNVAMNAATINSTTIDLRDASNALVPATVTYNASTFVATVTPTNPLANSSTYKLTVHSGASGVASSTGATLATDLTSSFTTVAAAAILNASYSSTPPTTAVPGQTLTYTMVVTNTGNQTWSATGATPVKLGVYFNGTSDAIGAWPTEPQQFNLPNDVAPGASVSIAVSIAAPASAGTYVLRQRMNQVGVSWFTPLQTSNLVVSAATQALSASYSSTPPTAVNPGQVLNYTMTVTNTGTQTWSSTGTNLVNLGVYFSGNSDTIYDWSVEPTRFKIPSNVAPGATVTIPVSIAAPTTAGTYVLRQRMVKEYVAWFTPLQTTTVVVGTQTLGASITPANGTTGADISTKATVTFTVAMNAATINSTNIDLRNAANAIVPSTVSYNATTRVATITPTSSLTNSSTYKVTVHSGASGVASSTGTTLAADLTSSFTTVAAVAQTQSYSLFSASTVPATVDNGDTTALELGVKFRSDVDGFITSIRYYKSAANTGTHVGNLWSSTGQLLATATFTSESSTGWQQVNFATPVAIKANTTYVASYHTNTGHYAIDTSYFATSGVTNGPLRGLAEGVDGSNGVATASASSAFPMYSYISSNYYVDVVLVKSPIASITPAAGATGVATNAAMTVTFNTAMTASTISTFTIELRNAANAVVAASVSYNATTRVATITPVGALANVSTYKLIVHGGANGVKDSTGVALATDVSTSFTTIAAGPSVTAVTPANNATNVSRSTTIVVTFDKTLTASTVNTTNFQLTNAAGTVIAATVTYNATNRTVTITPSARLASTSNFTLTVRSGTSGVKDSAGNAMATDFVTTFRTGTA